jgi:AcrR family transcriptional regulator
VVANEQGRRRYDTAGRQRHAAESRRVILEVAAQLFVQRGYAETSVADIAAGAGVSPRTVFGAFGSKVQLLKHAVDVAIVGDAEPVPLHDRTSMRRFHESSSLVEAVSALAAVFAEVGPRTYAIYNVVHRAADSDPQIAALERDLDRQRLTGVGLMTDTFARLLDVTDPEARHRIRDTLWLLGSPLQYGLLVHDRGWSVTAYQTWMEQALLSLVPAQVGDSER